MSESKGSDAPPYKLIGAAPDHRLSAHSDGLENLRQGEKLLTVLFVGQQGIGKSSLGNTVACIDGEDPCFPTAASFDHTTTGADFVKVGSSVLVDTQGQGGIHCGSEFDLRLMRTLSCVASAVVEVFDRTIDTYSYQNLMAQLEMYRSYSLRTAPPVLIFLRTSIASEGVTLASLLGEKKYRALRKLCSNVTLVVVPNLAGQDLAALQSNALVSGEASLGDAGRAYLAGARAVARWLKEQAAVLADSMLDPQEIKVCVREAVAAVNDEMNMAPADLTSNLVVALFKHWQRRQLSTLEAAVNAATSREDLSNAEARFFALCAAWANKYNDTPELVERLRVLWVASSKPILAKGVAALAARHKRQGAIKAMEAAAAAGVTGENGEMINVLAEIERIKKAFELAAVRIQPALREREIRKVHEAAGRVAQQAEDRHNLLRAKARSKLLKTVVFAGATTVAAAFAIGAAAVAHAPVLVLVAAAGAVLLAGAWAWSWWRTRNADSAAAASCPQPN